MKLLQVCLPGYVTTFTPMERCRKSGPRSKNRGDEKNADSLWSTAVFVYINENGATWGSRRWVHLAASFLAEYVVSRLLLPTVCEIVRIIIRIDFQESGHIAGDYRIHSAIFRDRRNQLQSR